MRGRLRELSIAIGNAPVATFLSPVLFLGWLIGSAILPGPQTGLAWWLSLLAALAGISAAGAGVASALTLERRYPPAVIACGAVCLAASAWSLLVEPALPVAFRLSVPLLFTAVIWFYVFYFSVYFGAQRESRLKVGEPFPDFALPDSTGRIVNRNLLVSAGPALILFYKGDW